jgi:hypothetical protein
VKRRALLTSNDPAQARKLNSRIETNAPPNARAGKRQTANGERQTSSRAIGISLELIGQLLFLNKAADLGSQRGKH